MRVLIVARYKEKGFAPFVDEQVAALVEAGIECRLFPVKSNNYFRFYPELKRTIRSFHPDIVHAHYGLCGLFANLQRRVPVVTTYHGSDINDPKVRRLSKMAIRLSAYNVFVSQKNIDLARPKKNYALIPCGINLDDFPLVGKEEARKEMGLDTEGKYVLFPGAFDNPVKNASLAQAAVSQLPGVQLLELKGFSRPQVALLMQAVDAMIMTSITEGSPQVVKEAMACGCPIVSVDVGDVRARIGGIEGCFVSDSRRPEQLTVLVHRALSFRERTSGRERIMADGLDNRSVVKRLLTVYESILAQ